MPSQLDSTKHFKFWGALELASCMQQAYTWKWAFSPKKYVKKEKKRQEGNTKHPKCNRLELVSSAIPAAVRMEEGWAVFFSEKHCLFIDGVNVAKQYGLN